MRRRPYWSLLLFNRNEKGDQAGRPSYYSLIFSHYFFFSGCADGVGAADGTGIPTGASAFGASSTFSTFTSKISFFPANGWFISRITVLSFTSFTSANII